MSEPQNTYLIHPVGALSGVPHGGSMTTATAPDPNELTGEERWEQFMEILALALAEAWTEGRLVVPEPDSPSIAA